jgi:hypothetical protein
MVFVLEFQNVDFVTFDQTLRSCQNFGSLNGWSSYGNILIICNKKNFVQFNLISFSFTIKVNIDCIARSYFILFTAGFYYRVNGTPPITTTVYSTRLLPLNAMDSLTNSKTALPYRLSNQQ